MDRDAQAVRCDPTLLADIRRYGRFDTTGCYQCGSCTISCDLVTDAATFPRTIIRYGLLGLRGPLGQSLEPWICHDCGDCSIVCPRQAEPRISMMTVRRFLSASYDWTGIGSRILRSNAWYIASLATVAALVLLLIATYHLWYAGLPLSDFATTSLGLEHMFPIATYFTLGVILFPLFVLLSQAARMWWLTMRPQTIGSIPVSAYVAVAWTYVEHSVTHTLMRKCEKRRWARHWPLALGTVIMLAVLVFGLRWFQTDRLYPLYHPQRWLGYLATAGILFGTGDAIARRIKGTTEIYKASDLRDLMFPVLLLLTALTGIAVHVLRYAGFALTAHFAYALHIVITTPMLVIEIPFGKWSHMIYRPLALYFQAVRERVRAQRAGGEVLHHAA